MMYLLLNEGDEVLLACEALLMTLRPWTLTATGCNSHVDFIVCTQMDFAFFSPTEMRNGQGDRPSEDECEEEAAALVSGHSDGV